ncbi:MAG TPA: response regulator [Candidatus Sumerlaeota bacterium]|nr:MAG: Transcriptional regulatory protein ZraR [candidate division BRC1 bacterium ADurb.BinA292]HOE97917.1 response regulator [Candidatus Sumerlaeota bacterium]HPK02382.1 response regulator [Candidatus Sumerlaeota bacterium]
MNRVKPPTTEASQTRILIVDDEPMLRSVVQDFLALLGYQKYWLAGDGREALEILRAHPIDVMLSDIRMPEMELEELLTIVNDEFPGLVVIATSGYSDFESARNILCRGAHDFLEKPLNLDALEQSIGWVIRRRRILDEVAEQFGAGPTGDEAWRRLDHLCDTLTDAGRTFPRALLHCVRTYQLSRRLDLPLSEEEHQELALAILLHEIGASLQVHSICALPRLLDEEELALVHHQSRHSARLVGQVLDRPPLLAMIADHVHWREISALDPNANAQTRLTVWLGLLNLLDGCLNSRADRGPIPIDQLRHSLQRRARQSPLAAVDHLLAKWPVVERFYASSL